jgi:hypothetical protein
LEKLMADGLKEIPGDPAATPVPESEAVWVELTPPELSDTDSVPVTAPTLEGANTTLMIQPLFGATLAPEQVPPGATLNGDVAVMEVTTRLALPELVRATARGELVVPTG